MNNTKIDWADSTWNPVTGCLHGCEYCYARSIANRFEGFEPRCGGEVIPDGKGTCPKSIYNSTHGEATHIFHTQPQKRTGLGKWQKASYPYGFEPTLHRYKLNEYAKKPGRTIFVCSMADLFGEWVPDEWIESVFDACADAPQHRYLFLTKNPWRYKRLKEKGVLPYGDNYWFGSTATTEREPFWWSKNHNAFVSIEPMLGAVGLVEDNPVKKVDWVILGAETGSRKGKVIPRREWIENIAEDCHEVGTAVFMKESLRGMMGDDFTQEFPWDNGKRGEK